MKSYAKNLRRACETKFQTQCKTKLTQLSHIKPITKCFNVSLTTFKLHQPEIIISFFNSIL